MEPRKLIFDDQADMHTHLELLKQGFEWRWAYPGERCPDGRLARRVYTRRQPVGGFYVRQDDVQRQSLPAR